MPTYTLRGDDGREVDYTCTIAQFRKLKRDDEDRVILAGGAYEVLLHGSGGLAPCWSGWGFRSDAMGVNPTQIKEQMEEDRKMGVTGVKYDRKSGEAVYESKDAREKHLKAYGFQNKSAYSGRA